MCKDEFQLTQGTRTARPTHMLNLSNDYFGIFLGKKCKQKIEIFSCHECIWNPLVRNLKNLWGRFQTDDFKLKDTKKNHLKVVFKCIFVCESHWKHDSVELGYNPWVYDFNHLPWDSDTNIGSRHQHQPACAEHSTISTDWVSTKDRTRHQRTWCLPSPPKAQIGAHFKGLSVLDSCLFKCTNHCHESQ